MGTNKFVVIGAAALVAVLMGVGAGFLIPSENANAIVQESLVKLYDVNTFLSGMEISVNITGGTPNFDQTFSATGRGAFDLTDAEHVKGSLSISAKDISLGANAGPIPPISLELIIDGKVLFLSVVGRGIPFLEPISGKWVKVNLEEAQEQLQGLAPGASAVSNTSFSKEQIERIKAVARDTRFLNVTKKLPDAVEGEEAQYHFAFEIKTEAVVEFMRKMKPIMLEVVPESDQTQFVADYDKGIATFEKSVGFLLPTGEIWIAKESHELRKIVAIQQTKGADLDALSTNPEFKNPDTNMRFALNLFSMNEPLTLRYPTDYLSIEEAMQLVFGGFLKEGAIQPAPEE